MEKEAPTSSISMRCMIFVIKDTHVSRRTEEVVYRKITPDFFKMRHFPNEEWFQTDLRQVCGFLKRTNDRMKLKHTEEKSLQFFSNLPEDAYDFLTVMAGIRNLRLIKQEVQSKGGGFDMCKAIKEMLRVSRQEGEQEGRLEGRQEGRLEGRKAMEGRLEGRGLSR